MVKSEDQTLSQEQEQAVKQIPESSDSESSSRVTDDRPDSLQSEASHTESLDGTGASSTAAEPPEHTAGTERNQAADASEKPSGEPGDGGSDSPNSSGDKVVKTAPGEIPTHRPLEESKNDTSPPSMGKKTNAANQKTADTREPVLDHNANVEQKDQTNQNGKNKSKQETTKRKVASASETPSQVTLINVHKAPRCKHV